MTLRAVYDTMAVLSWSAGPPDRKLSTIEALYDGTFRLVMSQEPVGEVRDVLNRPELRARLPRLTPDRVDKVVDEILRLAEWIPSVPAVFTWHHHPDDDHNFNLAIAASADRFVTREVRIRTLETNFPDDWGRLRALAPQLRIIEPPELAAELRELRPRHEPGQ